MLRKRKDDRTTTTADPLVENWVKSLTVQTKRLNICQVNQNKPIER